MEVIGYMDPISYGKFLNLFLKIIWICLMFF
jgi:hypothetical protein